MASIRDKLRGHGKRSHVRAHGDITPSTERRVIDAEWESDTAHHEAKESRHRFEHLVDDAIERMPRPGA